MSVVLNKSLYSKAKNKYKKMKHSAYKSALVMKEYKKLGGKYKGKKKTGSGITRWFKEKWRNQRGKVGYKKKGDIYRPTVRVNRKTPKTYKELGKTKIKRAMREKKKTGRVKKY